MKPTILSIVFGLILGLSACSGNTETLPTETIAELVESDPQFSGLLELLEIANLKATLSEAGPFTLFAPSNDALKKLETSPANEEEYRQLLLYHVLDQKLEAKDITASGTLTTRQGESLSYAVADDGVTLTDSRSNAVKVVKTDIKATNGVIHVIDKVLFLPTIPALPPTE